MGKDLFLTAMHGAIFAASWLSLVLIVIAR